MRKHKGAKVKQDKPEPVIQSAETHQELVKDIYPANSVRVPQEQLAAAQDGEKGIPADQVLAEIRTILGFSD